MSKISDIVADARKKIWVELWKAYGEMHRGRLFGVGTQAMRRGHIDQMISEIDLKMNDLCPAAYQGIYYTDFNSDGSITVTNKWTERFSAVVHVTSIRITAETTKEESCSDS